MPQSGPSIVPTMPPMSNLRTQLPDSRRSPRFAGISTFCRYPRLEDVAPEYAPVDWAIYGVPYDTGVTYRPGTRFGPRAIRDASQYVKRFSIPHDLDVCEVLSMADAGDAPVQPFHPAENLETVANWAVQLGDPSHTKLLAIGGDHSIAYANIEATWRKQGSPRGGLALIHIDSHLDTVDAVWGERWGHASPFIRAIEQGLIDPERMVSIGIKGPLNTATDLDFAKAHGVTIITREDWLTTGPSTLNAFLKTIAQDPAYITFDIDAIDPAYAPGTGTPSIGGFSSTEALAILRSLSGIQVCGADVVEVLPDRDIADNTALLAAHIMFEILCLSAVFSR